MTDTLEIFGTEYTGVTGIKATDDQSGTKVYIRPQGTKSITQNGTGIDVTEYASVDVSVSGGQPSLQSKTYNVSSAGTATVTADSGYDGLSSVSVVTPSAVVRVGLADDGYETVSGVRKWKAQPYAYAESAGFMNADTPVVDTLMYNAVPANTVITPSSTAQTVGGANYMMEGAITVAAASGSSKNVQVLQSTSRTNSSSLTKVLGDLTVSKTGTYDVYWSGGRSNTSTSYTWGTRLYVDGSGYGTENTTWSNNCQSNHLSNVSLTANQKLSVYARGRTGSYYTFAPMLVIIEA